MSFWLQKDKPKCRECRGATPLALAALPRVTNRSAAAPGAPMGVTWIQSIGLPTFLIRLAPIWLLPRRTPLIRPVTSHRFA